MAVAIKDLTHRYGERTALSKVSLSIEKNIRFALLGPNGGGKTTLFRILSTLLRPTSGSAHILGVNVLSQPQDVRRKIGVVFQSPALDDKLTVRENLLHHGHLYGLRGAELSSRIENLLDQFSLGDRRCERAAKLSGGLKRRVEVAKALLPKPELLLLDEPCTGLDPTARRELTAMLKESGATVLLTTHLLEEADSADRIAILDEGRLVADGTPDTLKREIGGDVISLTVADPETMRGRIVEKFGGTAEVLNGSVRIEKEDGHQFVTRVVEAFSGEIESVTVGRPTLEDVFIRHTGRIFA